MQEIYQCYSGPAFISGEIVRAKGTLPPQIPNRVKKYNPYQRNPVPIWPYDTLTMPHEAGLILEHEKFELIYPPEVHDAKVETYGGTFEEGYAYKPLLEPTEVSVETKLPGSESFYCTGKGCMFCPNKVLKSQ